mgnify:CR=1 FL=1
MKIIVDAMGGDYAPRVVIEGAVAAAKEYNIQISLVGDEEKIKSLLGRLGYKGDTISVYPARDVI